MHPASGLKTRLSAWGRRVLGGGLGGLLALAGGLGAEPGDLPWVDGEQLVFALRERFSGPVTGYAVSTIEAIERADGPGWRIRFQTLQDGPATTVIEVRGDSFLPARTFFRGATGAEVEASYAGDEIRVEQRTQATGSRFGLSAQTYSAYQSLYLLRRFPLEEGYQEEVWLVDPRRPMSRQPTVARLDDFRDLPTFEGSRRAARVVARIGEGRRTFWLGADARRLPYRLEEEGGAIMDLVEVRRPREGAVRFESPGFGYGFELPAGWAAFAKPGAEALPGRESVVFLVPAGAAELSLDRHPRFAPLEQVVKGSREWLARNRSSFGAGPTEALTLGGERGRGAWFTGQFEAEGGPRGILHAVIETEDSILLLTGTAPEGDFAGLREGVAALLRTLRLGEGAP